LEPLLAAIGSNYLPRTQASSISKSNFLPSDAFWKVPLPEVQNWKLSLAASSKVKDELFLR
jgi:hypothetical protein